MVSVRKFPLCACLQFLSAKKTLTSPSMRKSFWTLCSNSSVNYSHQFLKLPVIFNKKSAYHSRPSDPDTGIRSCEKADKSVKTSIDDELDMNIDLENELKWLNDRLRSGTKPSRKEAMQRDHLYTSSADLQEKDIRRWNIDLSLLNSQLYLDAASQYSRPVKSRLFPGYREQRARISSDRRPPPLTTDVAVEMITGELKAVFGLDRYLAHRIASWVRMPHYGTHHRRVRDKPHLPAVLETDPSTTEAVVARTRDTIRTLHDLGASPWLLHYLPMLLKMHSNELLSKAPLLVGPGLLSQVSEGLPLLLMPLPVLKRSLDKISVESRYLTQHRNRLYFMADALNVCVGTVCCGAAMVGASRILQVDLIKMARAMDIFKYYRLDRRYIVTHMDMFLLKLSDMRGRYDLLAKVTNSPQVMAALHIASQLPHHHRTWPSQPVSLMLQDDGTTAGDRGNRAGQSGNTAVAVAMRRKRSTGYSPPLATSSVNTEASHLEGTSSKAGDAPSVPLDRGVADSTSVSIAALRETLGDGNIIPPKMGYYEKNVIENFAPAKFLNSDGGTSVATPSCATCSFNAEELEQVLKEYIPPPVYVCSLSKTAFKTLYSRRQAAYRRSTGSQ